MTHSPSTPATATERVIREQFPFWHTAPDPGRAAPGTTYAVVGCGTSVHVADSIAATLNRHGFAARAVPGNEWAVRPRDHLVAERPHVVALSRSGESTETVAAAEASRARGWPVLAVTCAPGSALTRHADTVAAADTHPDEDIVMTASASLMLLLGLRFAGVAVDAPGAARDAEAVMAALDTGLDDALAGRSHFVFLGGGALHGIAREGALKLQEMSLSFTEAHHPMEYRHGPVSLVDGRTFVTLLYHDDTAAQEAVLAAELQAKGAFVLGLGGPGDLSLALPPDGGARGLLCLPALQLLGERVALAKGLDSTRPRHLTKVVLVP